MAEAGKVFVLQSLIIKILNFNNQSKPANKKLLHPFIND